MDFGGCVSLSIPDIAKLDEAKALVALRILWGTAGAQVLANVPRDGTQTGATFTGAAEDYAAFAAALLGSGVESELLMEPMPRAMIAAIKGE